MKFLQTIIQFFYPDLCFACRTLVCLGEVLCLDCLSTIKPIASRQFPITGKMSMTVHAVGAYEGALRKLINAKFNSNLSATKAIAHLMATLLPQEIFDVDYVVAIPLHWRRYARRGYNQCVEIAKGLEEELGVSYAPLLMRRQATKFQYLLSKQKRAENLENAFMLRPFVHKIAPGANILLIDDLCTTGATLQEAAHTLMQLKPASINAAVCARGLV